MKLCPPHKKGVPYGQYPPFFVAGCSTCEAKKAAGLVTGDEEGPLTLTGLHRIQSKKRRRLGMIRAAMRRQKETEK